MTAWPTKRMDSLCEITSSKRIFLSDYVSKGVPFYRGREITEKFNGNLCVSIEIFISEEKFVEIERIFGAPKEGDLLLTSVGTLGSPYVVKPNERFYFKDGNLTWFRGFKELDSRFLYFWLVSPQGKAELKKCTIGSSQSAFTIALLKGIEIDLPPLPIQRRIASILSAYDDLIENHSKRIAILEEMARRLYREWFVHFRYPGHEALPLVDSPMGWIPQGWEARRADTICHAILDGDWIESKDQGGCDYRLLQISNIGLGDFVETGNLRFISQATFERLRCTEIQPDDLLIARMPTPIGRAWLAKKMPWRMITAVDVAIVRPDNHQVDPVYLLYYWNQPSTLALIEKQSTGTTRLRITRRELCALIVPVPSRDVQSLFVEQVRPMIGLANNLREQIDVLRRTRDLLLPRLMSGTLSVEALTTAEAAVP